MIKIKKNTFNYMLDIFQNYLLFISNSQNMNNEIHVHKKFILPYHLHHKFPYKKSNYLNHKLLNYHQMDI